MKPKVFVDGQEGTTGLRIHEYLAGRSDLDVLRIAPDRRKDADERRRLLNAADVAFLCLPDAASREAAAMIDNPRTCLIDASTAHRTQPGWVYGLPELAPDQRARLRETRRIANPGCHASAFILLLRPLVDAGLVPSTLTVSATSLTGYSGGGRKMIEQYQRPRRVGSADAPGSRDDALSAPRPYGLGLAHKHLPEMATHTGLAQPPMFLPVVADFYKGLAVSVPLELAALRGPGGRAATAADVHAALAARYAGERYVIVRPLDDAATLEDGFFDVQACNDTNRVDLFVFGNARQVLLLARLDNLGKGASGAAVQSMNVHLGLEESLGLG